MIKERLGKLREVMKQEGVQCLVIPTSDYHNSEYVSEYFMARKYFSGFTGSAGTLVVAEDQAALFTDGRYFIQAARELSGSDITLMKMGEPGVPAVKDYIKEILKKGQKLGFDGRVVTAGEGEAYEKLAEAAEGQTVYDKDFCGMAWEGRPQLAFTSVYQLSEAYSGESCESKLARLREKMKEKGAEIHYLTTLDDIAWLFNLRADDVESCPVLLSYAAVTETESYLFAGEEAFSEEIREYLAKNHIILRPYDSFYDFVVARGKENKEEKILVCKNRINYRLLKELPGERLIDSANPTTRMKAVKNETEQENLRKAHRMALP
jgi:Xaa-Pro aminopeptidase